MRRTPLLRSLRPRWRDKRSSPFGVTSVFRTASCRWRKRSASACRRPSWSKSAASIIRRVASTPACGRGGLGGPRRVARRPLPSMMMPACSRAAGFSRRGVAEHLPRSPGNVASRSSGLDIRGEEGAPVLTGSLRGVAHQLFEHGEMVEEAAPAGLGQAAGGVCGRLPSWPLTSTGPASCSACR